MKTTSKLALRVWRDFYQSDTLMKKNEVQSIRLNKFKIHGRNWLIGVGIVFLIGITGCGKKSQNLFQTVEVHRGNLSLTVLATGNVQPNNALIIYPPISGEIDKINVVEGQKIKKGQLLMTMSSSERATLLDEAEAQGPKELAYWKTLYAKTPLLSPENGQIIYLPTVPGQIVNTSTELMEISDHLIVATEVDEVDLARIRLNQKVRITLDAYPNDSFRGTVRRIAYQSTLVNNVTNFEVDVWPTVVPNFMRSGMTANVVFELSQKKNILLIPTIAIEQTSNGASYVLVPTAKGTPRQVVIQTGASDGKQTEVLSGLHNGEKILVRSFSVNQWEPSTTGTSPFMPNFHKKKTPPKSKANG